MIVVYGGAPQVGSSKPAAIRMHVAEEQGGLSRKYGTVETYGPLGSPAIKLTSDQTGGAVQTFDAAGNRKQVRMRLRQPPQGEKPDDGDEDPRSAPPKPPVPNDQAAPGNGANDESAE